MNTRMLLLTAITALILGCSCNSTGSSALIGTWTTSDGCADKVTFTSDTWYEHTQAIGSNPAFETTGPVSYSVSQTQNSAGQVIFVTGRSGTESWILNDANHATAGAFGNCHYTRQ